MNTTCRITQPHIASRELSSDQRKYDLVHSYHRSEFSPRPLLCMKLTIHGIFSSLSPDHRQRRIVKAYHSI